MKTSLIWGGKFRVDALTWRPSVGDAPRPPCSSENIDSALPVNAHYNINPGPFGPVTLNTFALIVTD